VTASASGPEVVLVVAVAENGVIGRDGMLPWRLKSDMAHFRALTMGKPVVMGRKTWASLSRRPLPGRTNIVITRNPDFAAPGALVVPSVEGALSAARGDALRRGADAIMVIGGAEIFAATLPVADRIELTCVHAVPEGDATFPPFAETEWREVLRKDHPAGPDDESSFSIMTYVRDNQARRSAPAAARAR
jgi:dihydrofolate reductase